jgi:glutamate dehydrogenase (NAD(P)+)
MNADPSSLSYVPVSPTGPWSTYLSQIDRVVPHLGGLARWADTLKHPKRTLIVDVPIEMDNGEVRHFEGFTFSTICRAAPERAAFVFIRRSRSRR